MVFLLESLVFIFVGLSLRGVLDRISGVGQGIGDLIIPVSAVVFTVILARFVWLLGTGALKRVLLFRRFRSGEPSSIKTTTIMSWAGMRGVVTLTGALSLPEQMPGRDIVLIAAFAVIIVTVLVQGTTLGPLATLLKLASPDEEQQLRDNEASAWRRVAEAQYRAIQKRSQKEDGSEMHPRLLDQYRHRAQVAAQYEADRDMHEGIKVDHFRTVLEALQAGRAEILRMHRAGEIHDRVLQDLEHELDLQEIAAENRL